MIVLIDMDGVLADFDSALPLDQRRPVGTSAWNPPAMFEPGFFRNLPLVPGAKESLAILMAQPHLDIYIGSKPTTKNLDCPSEKYDWVARNFPALLRRIVLVCDKKLLRGDVLVDDDRQWESSFNGRFIYFDRGHQLDSWREITRTLVSGE